MNPNVENVLETYPVVAREKIVALRKLIFDTASKIEGVGALEETLKWGEPAYLTTQSKSGSTIRIAWKSSHADQYSMYFNCQTSLVTSIKLLFPELDCVRNREIRFRINEELPENVRHCIAMALTYKKPQLLNHQQYSKS